MDKDREALQPSATSFVYKCRMSHAQLVTLYGKITLYRIPGDQLFCRLSLIIILKG